MQLNANYLGMFTAIALVAAGCGKEDPGTTPDAGTEPTGFQQPANTVAISFSIDTKNVPNFYKSEELEWKGTFSYDKETRLLTYDVSWANGEGPYAPLYDDGAWDKGGHEPKGATAGDGIFGITAFAPSPTSLPEGATTQDWSYGAQIAPGTDKCSNPGGCWIWQGDNGGFSIPLNSTDPVDLEAFVLPPPGQYDIRLSLDTNALNIDPSTVSFSEPVQVKGSYCFWNTETVSDSGNGVYTYVLSASPVCLKANAGQTVQFVWMFTNSMDSSSYEYKLAEGTAAAYKGPADAEWVTAEVTKPNADANPQFAIPAAP